MLKQKVLNNTVCDSHNAFEIVSFTSVFTLIYTGARDKLSNNTACASAGPNAFQKVFVNLVLRVLQFAPSLLLILQ